MPRNPLKPRKPPKTLEFLNDVAVLLSTEIATSVPPPKSLLEGYAAIVRELDLCAGLMRSYEALTDGEAATLRRHMVRLVVVITRTAMRYLQDRGPVA